MSRPPASFNPFPGLRSFLADEDYLFFGREEQTMELLERLGKHRFVAVVGTSGSGKSSLVRCGLLSELLGGKMLEAGAHWEVAVTHPGGNPLALLTESLLEADLYDREAENARENLLATLSRSHFGLVEAIKQSDLGEDSNFLLVVDQFEEIFRFNEAGQTQQELANEFVSILLEAVAQKDVPIYIVLTMRSDFIGECGQFEGLAEMVNQGEFLIPRLSREQYKRIIEGPIKVASGQITPRLLQRLLNDIGHHADQLPCLQHALMRTWDVRRAGHENGALDLDDYERIGKMTHALSFHADEVYHALASDRERELCRRLFQALTVQESENRGVRRPQRLSGLCRVLEVERDELIPVIDAFRRPGVTFLMPPAEVELTDQTIIDISHESLMRVWTRLRQWVEEEAQAAGIYRRLSESAALYHQGKAGLYRDPELGIALAWRSAMHPNRPWAERYVAGFDKAMQFLDASQEASKAEENARESARQKELEQAQELAEARQQRLKQQQRAARKLRAILAILAVVAVAAGIAFGAALIANANANHLAEVANQEANKAQENADAADRERQTAETAQKQTEQALIQVEASKSQAETNLQKAEVAEKRSREFRYATDMQLAAMLLADEQANAGEVLKRLNEQDPAKNSNLRAEDDLRGFEWHYLRHLIDSRAVLFPGSEAEVVGAALTKDGELVLLNAQAELRRFDAYARQETRPVLDLKRGRTVRTLALSPDGQKVALCFDAKTVHIVDAATGEATIPAIPIAGFNGLIFSPDSQMLIVANNSISWWDANAGKPIAVLAESKIDSLGPLAISADGLTVAIGGQGSSNRCFSVFRMDLANRDIKVQRDKQDALLGSLRAVALSPDGESVIVSQLFSGYMRTFQSTTGQILGSNYTGHSASVSAIAVQQNGNRVVTASLDGTVKVWRDVSFQTMETALVGHAEEVTHLAFSAEGNRLVSSSRDKTTRLWDLEGKGSDPHRKMGSNGNYRAAFSPDGLLSHSVTPTADKWTQLLDASTGQPVRSLPNTTELFPDSVAFSPDNRILALGAGGAVGQSFIELWDIDRAEQLAVLPGSTAIPDYKTDEYSGVVSGLAFSPDGTRLVAGFGSLISLPAGDRGNYPLVVYDVPTRQVIRFLEGHGNYAISVRFSQDGKRLASASYDGTARIWSTETWKTLHVLDNPDPSSDVGYRRVSDVAFSPDGKLLAMASQEGNAHVFDAATGEHLQTLRGHANGVWCVAFSPDGATLATGSTDTTIRLWNVATWRELLKLDTDVVFSPRSLAFSPDGRQLLCAGGNMFSWSTRPDEGLGPDQFAKALARLLKSPVDFQSRIRMLSENPRLQEGLAILQSQKPEDARVRAAFAAVEAHGLASREKWPEAVAAFDRLKSASSDSPENWLRTPGLFRLATALVHEGRPGDASRLVTGGASRRAQDGISKIINEAILGISFRIQNGQVQIVSVQPKLSVAGLHVGDVILKINDVDVDQNSNVGQMLSGDAGTRIRFTVRHANSQQVEDIEVVKQKEFLDTATNLTLSPLRELIGEKLAATPGDPGLLELRAELAGQWSGFEEQAADYTAAIEALTQNPRAGSDADLKRLYRRRGDVHAALKNWQEAAADYEHIASDSGADDKLLTQQALAQANLLLASLGDETAFPETDWRILKSEEVRSESGAKIKWEEDGSVLFEEGDGSAKSGALTLKVDPGPSKALRVETAAGPKFVEYRSEAVDARKTEAGAFFGQFVRLDLPGDNSQFFRVPIEGDPKGKTINLAELQVFQSDQNIALGKKARQSSDWSNSWRAERAVDGNTLGRDGPGNPYAHTKVEQQPWWEVDLGSEQAIDRIVVWNRNQGDLYKRMAHFRIRILDANRQVVFEQFFVDPPNTSREIPIRSVLAKNSTPSATEKQWLMLHLERSSPDNAWDRMRISCRDRIFSFAREERRLLAQNAADPWAKLAAAHWVTENREAINQLVKRHPQSAGPVGDLFAQEKDWPRALEIYSQAIVPETTDADLLARRAKAHEALQNWDAASLDWGRAAANSPTGAKLLAEFAKRLADAGQLAQAVDQRKLAQDHYESGLNDDPQNVLAAEDLAKFLLDSSDPLGKAQWTVVKPSEITSANGEEFAIEEDGGIFVSGPRPDRAIYVLRLKADLPTVSALRIETLPDPRLPDGGAGRFDNGNYHVSEVSAMLASQDGQSQPVEIVSAEVDFHPDWNNAANLIDGKPETRWDTIDKVLERHWAVLSFRNAIPSEKGDLIVTLDSGTNEYPKHGLGRFRLSVTDEKAFVGDPAILRKAVATIPNPQIRLAAAYTLAGQPDKAAEWIDRALFHADSYQQRTELLGHFIAFPEVLAAVHRLRPDDPQSQITLARGHVQQGRNHLDQKRAGDALAELESGRGILAEALEDHPMPKWDVLKPVEITSTAGVTLSIENDDSVLATGKRPTMDTYTFTADRPPKEITSLRLETLPDDRLPVRGSGRSDYGLFQLKELRVFRIDPSGNRAAVNIKRAASDAKSSYAISNATDRRSGTYWDVSPTQNKPHLAVFEFAEPLTDVSQLVVELDSGSETFATLGRFRLSVSGDQKALESEQVRMDLNAGELADLDVAFGQGYSLEGETQKAAEAFTAALEKAASPEDEQMLLAQFKGFEDALAEAAKRRPADHSLHVVLARNLAERGKTTFSQHRQQEALADLDQARSVFARLIADLPQPEWTVLEPATMISSAGATLTLQEDGSIYASGNFQALDTYTLDFPNVPKGITAIRVEALRDDRLPSGGPGTYTSGNFVLSDFYMRTPEGANPAQTPPIPLRAVFATYEERPLAASLSEGESGWSVGGGGAGQTQTAVFAIDGREGEWKSEQLRISLHFSHIPANNQPAVLGRFRLSVTTDAIVKQALELQHQLKASGLMDLEIALGKVNADRGEDKEAASAFNRALALATDLEMTEKIIKEASARTALLEKLAELRPEDARFQNALARNYLLHGDTKRSTTSTQKARESYETRLKGTDGTSQDAKELADLLLELHPVDWVILRPTEIKSQDGATLTLQDDGSILASGVNPDFDVYTVLANAGLESIAAIRLETLPDPSMPIGGSGRANGNGNFGLSEFKAAALPANPGEAPPFRWKEAFSEHSVAPAEHYRKTAMHIGLAIDGNKATSWESWPKSATSQSAIFVPEGPIKDRQLAFTLEFGAMTKHNLGRFRLSVTGDSDAILRETNRIAALKLTSPWLRLSAAYRAEGELDQALAMCFRAYDMAQSGSEKAEIARQLAEFDDVFSQLLKRSPDDKWLLLGQVRFLAPQKIAEKKFQEAVDLLTGAIALFPDDLELHRLRAASSRELHDWQAALGDLTQVIERETDVSKKRTAEHTKVETQIRLGQTAEAAEAATLQMLMTTEWDTVRNAYAAQLLAGNPGVSKVAASKLYQSLSGKTDLSASWSGWLVRTHVAVPGLVTTANRQRLLDAAQKAGGTWTAPLAAAIHYRSGDLKQAEPLLTTSSNRQMQAMAALLLYDQGKTTEARSLLHQIEIGFQTDSEKSPDSAVPVHIAWQDWAIARGLYREAVRKLAGPELAELDKLLEQEPDNAAALLTRANLLSSAGLHDEAFADLNKAEKVNPEASELPGLKGRILAGLNRADEALASLNDAIARDSADPLVYAARGGIFLMRGQTEQARIDLEKSLDIQPTELATLHLSNLLLKQAETATSWTVLKPKDMKSTGGATLTLQDDGSILASGANVSGDNYRISFDADFERLAAVRLEALPDESLPQLGPGRHSTGNFQLSEFRVLLQRGEEASELTPLPVDSAWASFDYKSSDADVAGTIHPNLKKVWHVWGRIGEPHQAYFLVGKSPTAVKGRAVIIELRHQEYAEGINLGRFRLSISEDSRAFAREKDLVAALTTANPWTRLAAAYRLSGEEARLDALIAERPEMEIEFADAYAADNDWGKAIRLYNKAVAASPNDGELLAKRAEAFGRLNQKEQADKDWQKVFELNPMNEALRTRWLDSLTKGERWDDIAREYSRQLDALPEGRMSHSPRGKLMGTIIRRHDPVNERLMALRPDDTLPRMSLARDAILRSDWANAVKEFDELIHSMPPGEEGYEYTAALLLAGKPKEAQDFLKKLVERTEKPIPADMGFILARAASLFPEEVVPWTEIVKWSESAVASDLNKAWYKHTAGLANLRAGNLDKAKVWLEKSAATTWHPELNHLALSIVYARQGNANKARESFQKAQDWLNQTEANKKDGYYPVQDTDWLEFQILLREVGKTRE